MAGATRKISCKHQLPTQFVLRRFLEKKIPWDLCLFPASKSSRVKNLIENF